MHPRPRLPSIPPAPNHTGMLHGPEGPTRPIRWAIAEEVPVALNYDDDTSVVMLATPADLEDFALGFSYSEGVIGRPGDIEVMAVSAVPQGFSIDILISKEKAAHRRLRKRAIEGRSGCGLCGVESIEAALRLEKPVLRNFNLDPSAVAKAFRAMPDHQPLNAITHSVHAAAFVSPEGEILLAREDVGRHNALDKLIGACLKAQITMEMGFVVMSSRLSFELVQKAAMAGVPYLAAISAPTSLALTMAAKAGIGLASLAPGGVVMLDDLGMEG